MKLLGLHISDHDANMSYFDGHRVRYHKLERSLQIKHYGTTSGIEFLSVLKNWGVDLSSIDDVAVVIDDEYINQFKNTFELEFERVEHHYAHSLSVWPVTKQPVDVSFVFDGDGDYDRSFSIYNGNNLVHSKTNKECPSFGTLLETVAKTCGITGHELDLAGKAMGLKSYGLADLALLEQLKDSSLEDIRTVVERFNGLPIDLLATLHRFAETKFPEYFIENTAPWHTASFTGGVSQNSVINGMLSKAYKDVVIPPHGGDEGLSLGCLEFLRLKHSLDSFDRTGFPYWQDDQQPDTDITVETLTKVSELLAQGKIVGWYQGHGEIGPRALGNRSILMDPRIKDGKDRLNLKVKHRENFRPFGCSVLEEQASKYFDLTEPSPYMLHVVNSKTQDFPAITHVDGTTRIQTVSDTSPLYRALLESFYQITDCPVLLNTSLNVNSRPIAGYVNDAMELFNNSEMDAVCIGGELFVK